MNKYGVSHFQIILIRDVPSKNKEEMLREERMQFDKVDFKKRLNQIRPILLSDERNGTYKEYCGKNKDSINKRRREKRAHNKLMQELPFYHVPITVVFGNTHPFQLLLSILVIIISFFIKRQHKITH